MGRDSLLKIHYLKSVDSTQLYLKEKLQKDLLRAPCAVYTHSQTSGVGSRDNSWRGIDGNLFLSFALPIKSLPKDLPLESSSIYFSYLLKEVFAELGSQVWIKWPNDFYIQDKKAGGMITNIVADTLLCGVGINLVDTPDGFAKLDVSIDTKEVLEKYFKKIEKNFSWKQVFSKYKLEFYKNQNFSTHKNNLRISLQDAVLQEDGSVMINGERIYSLR